MPSGRVLQPRITTRQIIADAATKYLIPMCAQARQYHRSSNFNHRSVIWKLIYLAHREIPDTAYALLKYFRTTKATSDLRTKLLHSPQDISFCYFADAKPSGIWFKAFAAPLLSTTKSRFRTSRIPTYGPCLASHASKLHTYVATTITTISEYHLLSPAPYGTAFDDNTGTLETARLPKMRTSTKATAVAPHHFREFVRHRSINIYPVSTDDLLANLFYKPLTQINVAKQRLQRRLLSFIHTAFVRECGITYIYPSRDNGCSLTDIISIMGSLAYLFTM